MICPECGDSFDVFDGRVQETGTCPGCDSPIEFTEDEEGDEY